MTVVDIEVLKSKLDFTIVFILIMIDAAVGLQCFIFSHHGGRQTAEEPQEELQASVLSEAST